MRSSRREARTAHDVSAGGVVFRVEGRAIEVVLVGRDDRWNLPKGTPELGETLPQTAMREVTEETGLRVQIVEPIGEIHYSFSIRGVRHLKIVHFYLMEATGGDTANHDWEHDYVEWIPTDQALRRISFPNEARIIEDGARLIAARYGTSSNEATV
jgi:8-oxo-dGTP diphosphatase